MYVNNISKFDNFIAHRNSIQKKNASEFKFVFVVIFDLLQFFFFLNIYYLAILDLCTIYIQCLNKKI